MEWCLPPVCFRDAEHARLAANAEELIRQQHALLGDADSPGFQEYVARLRAHVAEVSKYLDTLPAPSK